jgi:hypothetical protein
MPFDIQIPLQKPLRGLIWVIVPPSIVGLYLTSNSDSRLNRGLGTFGFPVRIGVPPEITLLTLRPASPAAGFLRV